MRGHLFETAVAIGQLLSGVAFLTVQQAVLLSPVGRHVHPWDQVWSVLYVLGGAATLYGLADGWQRLRFRVAGLTLLATGLTMQGVAAAWRELEPRVLTYFVYATACALRAVVCGREARAGNHRYREEQA
jgi:hypothetical protein